MNKEISIFNKTIDKFNGDALKIMREFVNVASNGSRDTRIANPDPGPDRMNPRKIGSQSEAEKKAVLELEKQQVTPLEEPEEGAENATVQEQVSKTVKGLEKFFAKNPTEKATEEDIFKEENHLANLVKKQLYQNINTTDMSSYLRVGDIRSAKTLPNADFFEGFDLTSDESLHACVKTIHRNLGSKNGRT